MPRRQVRLDPQPAAEAKSIVALPFRNGPIEDSHAGKECPSCAGKVKSSHITQAEMKNIMKRAVDTVYKLLWLKQNDPDKYETTLESATDTRGFGMSRKRTLASYQGLDGSAIGPAKVVTKAACTCLPGKLTEEHDLPKITGPFKILMNPIRSSCLPPSFFSRWALQRNC